MRKEARLGGTSDMRHGYEMAKRGAVIVSEGYCPACHEVKPADDAGSCESCAGALIDVHERFVLPDEQEAGAAGTASAAKADDLEALVAAGAPAVSPSSDVLPPPEPPPPPPAFVAPARGGAAVPARSPGAAPAALGVPDLTATRLTAGVVPSRLQGTGERLLTLAAVGLLFLWLLQLSMAGAWVMSLTEVWGEQVFVAIRTSEARTVGPLFLLVPATVILMVGLVLYPAAGRGRRVADYALIWAGLLAAWLCLLAMLRTGDNGGSTPAWVVAGLLGAFILVLAGAILLNRHLRPYQSALKAHLGVKRLYRRRGLGIRFGIMGALWALGSVWYVAILVAGRGWTIQPGGYIAGVFLGLGLVGALAMLSGLRRPLVWIDEEGHTIEPQVGGSGQPGAPLMT